MHQRHFERADKAAERDSAGLGDTPPGSDEAGLDGGEGKVETIVAEGDDTQAASAPVLPNGTQGAGGAAGEGAGAAGEGAGADLRAKGRLKKVAAERTGEIGRTAAGRTSELGRAAAGKTTELSRSAAGKTGEIGRVAATKSVEIGRTVARLDVPWARGRSAGLVREGIHEFAIKPVIAYYTRPREIGVERLSGLEPPVIFAANHSSHLDAPTILRALPRRWRRRTAVAAAADYFYKTRAIANAFALVFNTVPLARRGGGLSKGSTSHVDNLIDQKWNLLMFPEGTRSRDGRIGKLRTGAAVIAAHHDIPIVPIYVRGTHEAMPPGRTWPRRLPGRFFSHRHRVDICFGEPIMASEAASRDDVMERVRAFFTEQARHGDQVPRPPQRPPFPRFHAG